MNIIDAHLHLFPPDPETEETARQVGHHNSTDHLRQVYGQLSVVHGVVMGNHSLDPDYHQYPAELFHYCAGLDSSMQDEGGGFSPDYVSLLEDNLRRESCCGVKLYPGYNRIWLSDPLYEPVYRLAAQYGKPVAVHTGLTAFPGAHLKYAHPLALDEVAADHPETQFVIFRIRRRGGGEEPQCRRGSLGPSGGPGGPGPLFPGAGGLCQPASDLADGHWSVGQSSLRNGLAHRQPGGVHCVYTTAHTGRALGGGVFPERQPDLRPGTLRRPLGAWWTESAPIPQRLHRRHAGPDGRRMGPLRFACADFHIAMGGFYDSKHCV